MKATMASTWRRKVMAHILKEKMSLGGEKLKVTILFTDIRSFTTHQRADGTRQKLVGLLNEYFTEMVEAVLAEDGVVDKYIGDAIMVVFGAPGAGAQRRAATRCAAAVRMRQALSRLNARLAERGVPPLRTGIGIHTGEAVAGSIGQRGAAAVHGHRRRGEPRVAARDGDEGPGRERAHQRAHLRAREGRVVARPMKEITVKGREQPVMTYEVIGLKGEVPLEAGSSPALLGAKGQEPTAKAP